jgi:ribosomal protein S18 acetylase RimI-like enzyme
VLTIRDARQADAEEIAGVQVDSWRTTYPGLVPDRVLVHMSRRRQAIEWAVALAEPRVRHAVMVAEWDGAGVVGFGSCGPARRTGLSHTGEVYTLYVLPEYQDRGIGRELLIAMFGALRVREMDSAMVWVLAENPSRFFYETMGGQRVAERDEKAWNVVLREAAYGWSDLSTVDTVRRG